MTAEFAIQDVDAPTEIPTWWARKKMEALMNVTGLGGSPYMQGIQPTQNSRQTMAAGGMNVREMAQNEMAEKSLPIKAAGVAARAATEAKGMFVDTYA